MTAELILTSPAFVNPLKERELDLRGNKIAQIENLGATEDQYDVLDFSDNDITRLDGFPLLNRLSTILLNNNRLTSIATGLGTKISALETLMLTGNRIENLSDLDPLGEFKRLHNLSLLRNPVTKVKNYRLYVIRLVPSLRVLDFMKIKDKERLEAKKVFSAEVGKGGSQTKGTSNGSNALPASGIGLTEEQKQKLEQLISRATSTDEIQKYERILRSGKIPKNLEHIFSQPKE
uniref:U2A'/phosphoprotein 32 family A C-terminal domain-containing protein n=1 Tax=Arcella intermedia TaxID=1963864 RepID=A0A6B2LG35_9EUKA